MIDHTLPQTRRPLKIDGKNPAPYLRTLMCQRCCHRWKADLSVTPLYKFDCPECAFGWVDYAYVRLSKEGRS